jgi:carboxyl-terminal processing protease
MNIKFKFSTALLAFALLVNGFVANASDKNTLPDPEKDKVLILVLKNILTRGHFVVKEMNDARGS